MKVAVSIPDPVFAEVELLAKRMNTSRSDIYARALDAFVGMHAPDRVTAAMNEAVGAVEDRAGEMVRAAARRVLDGVEW